MSGTPDLKSSSSFLAFSPFALSTYIKHFLHAEYSSKTYQEGCTKILAFWKYWKRYKVVLLNKWKISILPAHYLPHIYTWMVPIKLSWEMEAMWLWARNVFHPLSFLVGFQYVRALLIVRCLEFMWSDKGRVTMTKHSPFILLLWMHPKVRLAESVGTFSCCFI